MISELATLAGAVRPLEAVGLGVACGDGLRVGFGVDLGVSSGVAEGLGVSSGLGDGDSDGDAVSVGDSSAIGLGDGFGVAEGLGVGVGVRVEVGRGDVDFFALGDPSDDGVGERFRDGVEEEELFDFFRGGGVLVKKSFTLPNTPCSAARASWPSPMASVITTKIPNSFFMCRRP